MILKGEFKANYMIRKGEHMERRFIEETFPIKEISQSCYEEDGIKRGHIRSLHKWWARRPLGASRTTAYASLIPYHENESEKSKLFLIELSKWKNTTNKNILDQARKKISKQFNNKPPKILDPFCGGGSFPLESMRLGCETYASDYNPVATLISKCTLEFPQKFSKVFSVEELSSEMKSSLVRDVTYWSGWVLEQVTKELGDIYPNDDEQSIPIGYIWARTIQCQNQSCRREIPLIKQYWLAKKSNKKIALYPIIKNSDVHFKIVGTGYEKFPNEFDPKNATLSRSIAKCLVCGHIVDAKTTRKLFLEHKSGERLIAVIYKCLNKSGKKYRISTDKDYEKFLLSKKLLERKIVVFKNEFGFDALPDQEIPLMSGTINVPIYGLNKWSDLFNTRQKLTIITFIEKIRYAFAEIVKKSNEDHAIIITSYLSLILSRCLESNNNVVRWLNDVENAGQVFATASISMVWDYLELNIFSKDSRGTFHSAKNQVIRSLDFLTKCDYPRETNVKNMSALSLEWPNDYFDAVFTDPPYYDNVPYADLADFFYVWLRKILVDIYPDLFVTLYSPKNDEVGQLESWDQKRYAHKTKEYFETVLTKSFVEISRILKPEGIAVIVYAHKSTDGWESLINSLLSSGLIVTAAWPIHTEMKGRQRSIESASLASSIYMVCRKWKKEPIGFYRDVKKELKEYLNKKLEQLWNEGILGADFFISAIGSAVEVYGKFEKVVDDNDEKISVRKLLNDTRKIVTNYAINKVIKGEFSENISQMTRFYILWRWAYGESKVPFDNALKMAQSVGIDIEHEWNKGFIKKDKEFIRVLGPDERTEKELSDPHDLIDILHNALLLWKKEKRETVEKFLEEKGYKNSEVLKRVAQAISESLPIESTEKKWLDGFLTGFKETDSKNGSQSKLF